MASQPGPYYSNALEHSEQCSLTGNSNGQYPDLDPAMASNAHMYSLADGALQVHQNSTDRHFAGLIQAATAAAGQEASYAQDHGIVGTARRTTRQSRANVIGEGAPRAAKHITFYNASGYPDTGAFNVSSRKRKQQSDSAGLQQVSLPVQAGVRSTKLSNADRDQDSLQDTGSNTRVTGMQSATALFRSPSASSKKYTRPPLSKLFTSLELSPENFLHLQAVAKAYMLDPDHPERRDCVGQRGKGDSELVKMRLWNCVAKFLDEEGHGQFHFGEDILGEEGATRAMTWPRDRSKIIGAVIPLLRRMVTNERQREYAVETRKGGSAGSGKRQKSDPGLPSAARRNAEQGPRDQSYIGDSRIHDSGYPPGETSRSTPSARSFAGTTPYSSSLRLRFSIVEGRQRIRPCYEALAEECPDLQTIYAKVLQHYDDLALDRATVSVLLPQGLTSMHRDEDWVRALLTIQETEWMDDETKVVVRLL